MFSPTRYSTNYSPDRLSGIDGIGDWFQDTAFPFLVDAGKSVLQYETAKQTAKQQVAQAQIAQEASVIESIKNRVPLLLAIAAIGAVGYYGYITIKKRKK